MQEKITSTKSKISISVDTATLEKIDSKVHKGTFRNRSHAFEYAIHQALTEEEE